jgi:hypothetical protein
MVHPNREPDEIKKGRYLGLIAIGLFVLVCLFVGVFNIATVSGAVGKMQSTMAVIQGMARVKHRHFNMQGLDGVDYVVIPREDDFKKYKVGDTLRITFNILNRKYAFIDSPKHILYGELFGSLYLILIGIVVGLISIWKIKRGTYPKVNWVKEK